MAKRRKIEAAIERLANLYEYGHLMANTDPAALLETACDELEACRACKHEELEGDDGK